MNTATSFYSTVLNNISQRFTSGFGQNEIFSNFNQTKTNEFECNIIVCF